MTDKFGTCATCVNSRLAAQLGVTARYCKERPPAVHLLPGKAGSINVTGLHPPVGDDDWCGKFEREVLVQ